MAGVKVSDYALGNTNWTQFLTTIEKQRKGFIALSLTNYDNNNAPQIAAGSVVEISGALYQFESDEAINGTPTSGVVNYIYIDPTDIKPYWTTTAPTWSSAKGGWYDSTGTKRYIGGCNYDGTNYTGKWVYTIGHYVSEKSIADNSISTSKIIDEAVTAAKLAGESSVGFFLRSSGGTYTRTGVGFKPRKFIFFATLSAGTDRDWSVGLSNVTMNECIFVANNNTEMGRSTDYCVYVRKTSTPDVVYGKVTSTQEDGFTMDFTVSGTITAIIMYMALP